MVDTAFAKHVLRGCVRRIDFIDHPHIADDDKLLDELQAAVDFLNNPKLYLDEIQYNVVNGKPIARAATFRAKLALRKVDANLRCCIDSQPDDRQSIVNSLRGLLAEGVPYRVLRLDIRRFFESIDSDYLQRILASSVSPPSFATRRVVAEIINHHSAMGHSGVPRGLAMSSTLAELALSKFDATVERHPDVFFYRRYVDDIVIISSQREDPADFKRSIASCLPDGLVFKRVKECGFDAKRFKAKDAKAGNVTKYECIDYLGYRFYVAVEKHRKESLGRREVWLDVAESKVKKIKTRIVKSCLAFIADGDFTLFDKRIRHLTSNMSLMDRSKGIRRVVGIHYNYPLVDYVETRALRELDIFLRNLLFSTKGRVFRKLKLTNSQRAQISRYSFFAGAKGRRFYQLGVKALGQVQGGWKHG